MRQSTTLPALPAAWTRRRHRAVSAALALAYVALRLEDRVSLSSFAARPAIALRDYARLADFAALPGNGLTAKRDDRSSHPEAGGNATLRDTGRQA